MVKPTLRAGLTAVLASVVFTTAGTAPVEAEAPVPDVCSGPGISPGYAKYQPVEPDVVVVGDSQTVGEWCAGRLAERADARFHSYGLVAEVWAQNGARTEKVLGFLGELEPTRANLPPSIVFTGGGNDAAAGRSPAQFAAALRRLVNRIPRSRQIYLTTLSYNPEGTNESLRARRYAYNDVIRRIAKRYRNVHVIDFDLVVRRDHLEFHDEVHLVGAAYNIRAWHVAHAVATCGTTDVCPEPD